MHCRALPVIRAWSAESSRGEAAVKSHLETRAVACPNRETMQHATTHASATPARRQYVAIERFMRPWVVVGVDKFVEDALFSIVIADGRRSE